MDETHVERRLAAILVADIVGYSRLMAEDEAATVAALKGHQAVVLPMVAAHGGRIQDTAGDGILAEFRSVLQAVECALAIQRTMAERNAEVPPSRQMRFRIGINFGDVMHDGARPRSHRAGDLDQSLLRVFPRSGLRVESIAAGITATGP